MLMIRVGVAAAAMPTATVPLYSSPARGKHSSVLTPSSALTTSPSTTTSRRTPTADASLQVDAAAWWNHAGADAAAARGSIPPDPSLGASAGLSSPTATPPSSHNSADAPLPPRNAAGAIVPLPVNPLSAQLSAAAGGRITAIRRFSTAHGLDGSGAVNALTAVSSRPSLDAAGVLTPSQPLVMHAPGTLGTRPSDVSGALLPSMLGAPDRRSPPPSIDAAGVPSALPPLVTLVARSSSSTPGTAVVRALPPTLGAIDAHASASLPDAPDGALGTSLSTFVARSSSPTLGAADVRTLPSTVDVRALPPTLGAIDAHASASLPDAPDSALGTYSPDKLSPMLGAPDTCSPPILGAPDTCSVPSLGALSPSMLGAPDRRSPPPTTDAAGVPSALPLPVTLVARSSSSTPGTADVRAPSPTLSAADVRPLPPTLGAIDAHVPALLSDTPDGAHPSVLGALPPSVLDALDTHSPPLPIDATGVALSTPSPDVHKAQEVPNIFTHGRPNAYARGTANGAHTGTGVLPHPRASALSTDSFSPSSPSRCRSSPPPPSLSTYSYAPSQPSSLDMNDTRSTSSQPPPLDVLDARSSPPTPSAPGTAGALALLSSSLDTPDVCSSSPTPSALGAADMLAPPSSLDAADESELRLAFELVHIPLIFACAALAYSIAARAFSLITKVLPSKPALVMCTIACVLGTLLGNAHVQEHAHAGDSPVTSRTTVEDARPPLGVAPPPPPVTAECGALVRGARVVAG